MGIKDKNPKDFTPEEQQEFLNKLQERLTPKEFDMYQAIAQALNDPEGGPPPVNKYVEIARAIIAGIREFLPALHEEINKDAEIKKKVEKMRTDEFLDSELFDQLANRVIQRLETGDPARSIIADDLLTSPFLPMVNGAPVNGVMNLNTKNLTSTGFKKNATVTTDDGQKFTIEHYDKLQGTLNTPAKKILDTALLYLTDANYYRGGRNNVIASVEIPLKEYGEKCGYILSPRKMDTPEEQTAENKRVNERLKELKKTVRRDLHDLASILWTGEETKGRNKGDYKEMRIISSHSIRNGNIKINFDIDAAAYLTNAYMMNYPTALLKIDNRKPNAYEIGRKIAFHNSNDNNRRQGTENTLSVDSLLKAAPQIPTMQDLEERGQRNWKEKIKKPLESSLNENVSINLIKTWQYRDPKTYKTYSAEDAQAMTWTQYSRLMVDFVMIDAPEQEERRGKKEGVPKEQKGGYPRNIDQRKTLYLCYFFNPQNS